MARVEGGSERARLETLERMNDVATLRRIDSIGVTTNWRCLEVGPGAGSVARALAERVGAQGLVVAADLDPRFLGNFAGPGREVATHDIMAGPVPPTDFDFAHCRAVLPHVLDIDVALRHLIESVRPGGWILCEEPDYGSMEPSDPNHRYAADLIAFREMMIRGGLMDGYAGRHTFEAMRRAGLAGASNESHGAIAVGGTMRARYRIHSLEHLRARLINSASGFTEAKLDRMNAMFDDPGFEYVDNAWIASWAQVPGEPQERSGVSPSHA